MRVLDSLIVWFNEIRSGRSKRRYAPQDVLLLLPHCLQNQTCDAPLRKGLEHCKGCGRCKMKDLRELAERWGVKTCVASGGRAAQQRAREAHIKVIVAVACKKELAEGIRATFPKRVLSVPNSWPNGPCKDTDVDVSQVESILERIIDPQAAPGLAAKA